MVTQYLSLPKSSLHESIHIRELREYIATGDYQCAIDLLMQSQPAYAGTADLFGECLIQSARQLCVAAMQTQSEIDHHRKSLREIETRRSDLDNEIQAFIKLMTVVFETDRTKAPVVPTPILEKALLNVFKPIKAVPDTPTNPDIITSGTETKSTTPEVDTLKQADYRLEVYTLGMFQVYLNGEPVENWSSRKGTHIFKYLLFNREHPIHKEVLMEQFWPDSDSEAQRNNLNVAIYGLRQALREPDNEFSHVLFQNDCYFLNPDMDVWLDADAFNSRYQAAQKVAKQGDEKAAVMEYAAAEMLYEGTFLPEDTYEEWTDAVRQRLQLEYLDTLDHLSSYYLDAGDYGACANICQKMIGVEACSEDAHARLMRCYRRQGQVHLALRQYDRCVTMLESELQIEPSEDLTELYNKIRAGEMI